MSGKKVVNNTDIQSITVKVTKSGNVPCHVVEAHLHRMELGGGEARSMIQLWVKHTIEELKDIALSEQKAWTSHVKC